MRTSRLPPFNSLRAFEAAARRGSVLEAAAEQGVTPRSVSRYMELLERDLGTEPFIRRSDGVTLTAAGREYAGMPGGIFRNPRAETDGIPRVFTSATLTADQFS